MSELLDLFQPRKITHARRVFANRNLRLGGIEMVGFDMDYTLCEYHVTVESLSIRLTIERLVKTKRYPVQLLDSEYDPNFAIRGLTVDKQNGNLLKMDTHRHISHVFHGLRPLAKRERRELYRDERITPSSDRYALVDTLFAVPEAWLYALCIDLREAAGETLTPDDYEQMYEDIRSAIDLVHADQSLKRIITADLPTYVRKDPDLPLMLHRLRQSGKRLFLMTNSYGPYTNTVMTYLLNDMRSDYTRWQDYFDIIVVGSKKPGFFSLDKPFLLLDADFEPTAEPVLALERGMTYQGGNLADFHRMAGCSGDRILYVGDHLYGDILRSKKATTWRTAMIVPELERELSLTIDHDLDFDRRAELEAHRSQIDRELSQQHQLLHALSDFVEDRAGLFAAGELDAFEHAKQVARANIQSLEKALHTCLKQIWELNTRLATSFNENWGMLFKARAEHSVFGGQVEDYACIYTSRVTNFGAYSPFQYFRTPRDLLPHEHRLTEQAGDADTP